MRDSFKDLSRGDFFDRIEKIDQAMKDLVDNCSDGKIKELFPKGVKYYEDLYCLSSNHLFFKQMNVEYADKLYQEINKSAEDPVCLDVLKVEYLSYLISNKLIFDEKYRNDINAIFEILTIKPINIFLKPRTITDIFSRKMIDQLRLLKDKIKIADNFLEIMTPSLKVENLEYLLPKVTLEQLFYLCRNTKDTQEEKVRSEIFRATKEEINNNVQFSSKLYDILQEGGEKFVETIKFLTTKQEGQSSALISSEQLFELLNKKDQWNQTPLHDLKDENLLKTIKGLLEIPSIRSEGHNFLKPIFDAFYGRMPQNKGEAKEVNKIVQDIYFNLAVNQTVNDETVYRDAYDLAKNKEEELKDCHCLELCFPLAKEKALFGFTLPENPEDMILKYSQHRSPEDILKNYGEINDGLTNLANAIVNLNSNKLKEFLQNLYKNDLSKDKSNFKEFGEKIKNIAFLVDVPYEGVAYKIINPRNCQTLQQKMPLARF